MPQLRRRRNSTTAGLYVPVSSREESQVGDPRYPCCSFRGSVVALDAATGARIWKTYSVAQAAVATAKNSIGTQLYGPAGGAIWNTPTIDTRRNVLYVGTGNNFAPPATELSDSLVALDLNTGAVRWSRQVTENDIWNGSCRQPDREAAVCPDKDAPDFDFTGSALLVDVGNGRQLIVVGNKSGVIFGFDPDAAGTIVWQRRVAVGSSSGGVFWGSATDGVNIYAANADFVADKPAASGGMNAVDLRTGRVVWSVPGAGCANKTPCKPSQAAAVTLIAGAAFSGTMDGRLRAYSTRDGKVLWEYDTARDFATVNGVKANGGSMSNSGPAIVGGMLYVNSGYSHHGGILPGNVLLAFSSGVTLCASVTRAVRVASACADCQAWRHVLTAAALRRCRSLAAGPRSDRTALTGATVIDVVAGTAVPNAVIVIEGDKITAFGGSTTPIPAGAARVDLSGKFVIPGLFDSHVHYQPFLGELFSISVSPA